MMMVPFQSQRSDDVPESWRDSACGIANVKMIIEAKSGASPFMADLIAEGESMNGFGERGWTHDALVFLLHNHGIPAYREEFRSRTPDIAEKLTHHGLEKITTTLRAGTPVMVSLRKDSGSYHTVLLIDIAEDIFTYHDPDVGPEQKISRDDFLKQWKRLAIFV